MINEKYENEILELINDQLSDFDGSAESKAMTQSDLQGRITAIVSGIIRETGAPEMLEALQRINDFIKDNQWEKEISFYPMIEKAIKKAIGE